MDQAIGSLAHPAIDWSRPWYADWREVGAPVAARVQAGVPLHDALNAQRGAPVQFVAQEKLPAGQAYEEYIRGSGNCPVRPGLHDFFNGLVWLRLPRTKSRLNQLQAAEIEALGVGAVRGPVRDAITLFDENGALLDAPPPLWEALLAHDWRRLFVELRPLWDEARLLVVGHALLEKLAPQSSRPMRSPPSRSPRCRCWGFPHGGPKTRKFPSMMTSRSSDLAGHQNAKQLRPCSPPRRLEFRSTVLT